MIPCLRYRNAPSYVIVSDADAIYARAKAARADVVIDIKDEDYGDAGSLVATWKAGSGPSAPTTHGKSDETR